MKHLSCIYTGANEISDIRAEEILSKHFTNSFICSKNENFKELLTVVRADVFIINENTSFDHYSILEDVKKHNPEVKVIMIVEKLIKEKILEAIRNGITGYLTHPVARCELDTTIQRVCTELNTSTKKRLLDFSMICLEDNFFWNKEESALYKEVSRVNLTKKETSLLKILCDKPDKTHTYETLYTELYDEDFKKTDDSKLRTLHYRLSTKLHANIIEIKRGEGYKIIKLNWRNIDNMLLF